MAGTSQTPERAKREARRLRGEGRTWDEVAAATGLSVPTVRRVCGALATPGTKKRAPAVQPAQSPATGQPEAGDGPSDDAPGQAPRSLVAALEDELVDAIRERQRAKTPGDKAKLGKWVRDLIAQLDRLRPDPAPTREELEAKHRPRAEDVLGKIRNGVKAVAQREAETRKCLRCGHELEPEAVLRRRIEAGMADPAPMH